MGADERADVRLRVAKTGEFTKWSLIAICGIQDSAVCARRRRPRLKYEIGV